MLIFRNLPIPTDFIFEWWYLLASHTLSCAGDKLDLLEIVVKSVGFVIH